MADAGYYSSISLLFSSLAWTANQVYGQNALFGGLVLAAAFLYGLALSCLARSGGK